MYRVSVYFEEQDAEVPMHEFTANINLTDLREALNLRAVNNLIVEKELVSWKEIGWR